MGLSFWGAQFIGGESLAVPPPRDGELTLISMVALEEPKKDKIVDSVSVFLTIDKKKFVIGTLSPTSFPQIRLNLVIDKGFELSHNCFDGNVYVWGLDVSGEDTTMFPIFRPIVLIKKKRLQESKIVTPASSKLNAGTSQETDGDAVDGQKEVLTPRHEIPKSRAKISYKGCSSGIK